MRKRRHLMLQQLEGIEGNVWRQIESHYNMINWFYLDEDGWNKAIELKAGTNLTTDDCIHLATAIIIDCAVLVTRDTSLSGTAKNYVASGQPEEVIAQIKKL